MTCILCGERDLVLLEKYLSYYALEVEASRQLLACLIDGIIKFLLVYFGDDVERRHGSLDTGYLMLNAESDASQPLGVFLHNLDVAGGCTQLDCGLSSTVNQRVDFGGLCRGRSCNGRIIKIVDDSAVCRLGNKMEGSLAGKKRPGVSLRDICL